MPDQYLHYRKIHLPRDYDEKKDKTLEWKCEECLNTVVSTGFFTKIQVVYGCAICNWTGVKPCPSF